MSVKSDVLAYFETHRDQFVSGEFLSKELNVTRNAVCKAVNQLKKEGYKIKALTNRGYCMDSHNDILSSEGIIPYLNCSNKSVYVYETLESTNKTAKELAFNNASSGTVVIANEQTNGRGRQGRSFYSPHDSGIYMSIVIRPETEANNYSVITVAACVAVCRAIYNLTGIETQIKWVNDIYLNGKKICGILTEGIADLENGFMSCVVIGIGLNFNTSDFPEELKSIAASLFTGSTGDIGINRNRLCAEIINNIIELTIDTNLTNRVFIDEYKKKSFVVGKDITVHIGEKKSDATAIDIDNDGRLLIKDDTGNIKELSYGEISVRCKD